MTTPTDPSRAHGARHPDDGALERLDPTGRRDHIAAQHIARYAFASPYARGARVLDAACGPGYGSAMLADAGAASVLGVDYSTEAIAHAQTHHARPSVRYVQADALTLRPDEHGPFDTIVCIETLEHVNEPERLLRVLRDLLVPGGVLVLTVPNDRALHADNPHHRWRAEFDTVRTWLRERFSHTASALESHAVGSVLLPHPCPPDLDVRVRTLDNVAPDHAPGFVFVCSDDAARAVLQPAGAMLANGLGYIRELQSNLDTAWRECERLAGQAGRDAAEIARLQGVLREEQRRYEALWEQLTESNTDRADAHERARTYAAERDELHAIVRRAGTRKAQKMLEKIGLLERLDPSSDA